ncbi:MAG: DnaD domain protein [Bacteroidota bacterium]
MKTSPSKLENTQVLDVSEQSQLNYWSEKLGVRPEVIKTAIRACRSNAISSITSYVKQYKAA